MRAAGTNTVKQGQSGAALLLSLFALLLLSCIAMALYLSSGTETRIATNYGSSVDAYYAAKAGIQEIRDRVSYPSVTAPPNPPPAPGGLADKLPSDIAGNPSGVLYVLNPSPGEVVDPTNLSNRYFDDQLCHDYNSGAPAGAKCNVLPGVANWALPSQNSLLAAGTASALKWVRINMKTDRAMPQNYWVDSTASLDAPVCWDDITEQVAPGGALPGCDGNGMQNVYLLTALAVTPGVTNNSARRLLRSEVVPPSIRPAGAITMDAVNSAPQFGDGTTLPNTYVDGRPHTLDGSVITAGGRCSKVAALATDNGTVTTQLTQALNNVRLGIVQTANSVCNWDGTPLQSGKQCPPGLWWVRGTDPSPRFVTTITTTTTTNSGSDGDHNTTTTTSPCNSSTANCYMNLDLGAQELYAMSAVMGLHVPTVTQLPPNPSAPFAGGQGNEPGQGSMYQSSPSASTLPHEISAISALVGASINQSNYFAVRSANLASSYGSASSPAIVQITDSSLVLSTSLTGYGVLVVPNDLEVNVGGTLQWTGIVLVQGGNATFKLTGGTGQINGALMLQPGGATGTTSPGTANLITNNTPAFRISYSCDAIDMAFGSLAYKVLSSSEVSF